MSSTFNVHGKVTDGLRQPDQIRVTAPPSKRPSNFSTIVTQGVRAKERDELIAQIESYNSRSREIEDTMQNNRDAMAHEEREGRTRRGEAEQKKAELLASLNQRIQDYSILRHKDANATKNPELLLVRKKTREMLRSEDHDNENEITIKHLRERIESLEQTCHQLAINNQRSEDKQYESLQWLERNPTERDNAERRAEIGSTCFKDMPHIVSRTSDSSEVSYDAAEDTDEHEDQGENLISVTGRKHRNFLANFSVTANTPIGLAELCTGQENSIRNIGNQPVVPPNPSSPYFMAQTLEHEQHRTSDLKNRKAPGCKTSWRQRLGGFTSGDSDGKEITPPIRNAKLYTLEDLKGLQQANEEHDVLASEANLPEDALNVVCREAVDHAHLKQSSLADVREHKQEVDIHRVELQRAEVHHDKRNPLREATSDIETVEAHKRSQHKGLKSRQAEHQTRERFRQNQQQQLQESRRAVANFAINVANQECQQRPTESEQIQHELQRRTLQVDLVRLAHENKVQTTELLALRNELTRARSELQLERRKNGSLERRVTALEGQPEQYKQQLEAISKIRDDQIFIKEVYEDRNDTAFHTIALLQSENEKLQNQFDDLEFDQKKLINSREKLYQELLGLRRTNVLLETQKRLTAQKLMLADNLLKSLGHESWEQQCDQIQKNQLSAIARAVEMASVHRGPISFSAERGSPNGSQKHDVAKFSTTIDNEHILEAVSKRKAIFYDACIQNPPTWSHWAERECLIPHLHEVQATKSSSQQDTTSERGSTRSRISSHMPARRLLDKQDQCQKSDDTLETSVTNDHKANRRSPYAIRTQNRRFPAVPTLNPSHNMLHQQTVEFDDTSVIEGAPEQFIAVQVDDEDELPASAFTWRRRIASSKNSPHQSSSELSPTLFVPKPVESKGIGSRSHHGRRFSFVSPSVSQTPVGSSSDSARRASRSEIWTSPGMTQYRHLALERLRTISNDVAAAIKDLTTPARQAEAGENHSSRQANTGRRVSTVKRRRLNNVGEGDLENSAGFSTQSCDVAVNELFGTEALTPPANLFQQLLVSQAKEWDKGPLKNWRDKAITGSNSCLSMRAKKKGTTRDTPGTACISCIPEHRLCVSIINPGILTVMPLPEDHRQGTADDIEFWVQSRDLSS
ncbi:hypothetical protein H2198_001614 [Neophaeococcomyces mojaviensis]|uniref:Uncharacterized protein n=1 Tax=Neophaeococcomyces mojaviensis TaxID=3383035 RepID=A0ACC3AGR6_9EURO|nr:hypothetical protein H2198_001614 [Knufia sp. JES_112]